MKHFSQYINVRKSKSAIEATDETVKKIVKDELDKLGHDADLNHIDVSKVTDMAGLFMCNGYGSLRNSFGDRSYKDLNPDISKWDVSHVMDMESMFEHCENFNQDLSRWDVSNVKNMNGMFWNCENFNCDISGWDVSNVENMHYMFHGCKRFNQNLSIWDVRKVENHQFMFVDCPIEKEFKPKFKK